MSVPEAVSGYGYGYGSGEDGYGDGYGYGGDGYGFGQSLRPLRPFQRGMQEGRPRRLLR